MNLMSILNGKLLYVLVIIALLSIFGICIFFYRRGKKRAIELGVDKDAFNSTMKGAAIFSIVPSIAVIIGVISLTPLLGVPWPWFRLSVVGSLGYELMAADLAVKGAGFESLSSFNTSGDISAIGTILFVMSIGIMTGMILNIFFLKRIHKGVSKVGNKQSPAIALSLSCLTIGMMSVFVPLQFTISKVHAITLAASGASTYILTRISEKYGIKWLNDFIMSFALVIGMVVAVIVETVLI